MRKQLKLTALALGLFAAGQAMAADLTVVSFGGANKAAQVKAFYEPWEKAGKGKIIAGEYNGEMAKVSHGRHQERVVEPGGSGVARVGPWL